MRKVMKGIFVSLMVESTEQTSAWQWTPCVSLVNLGINLSQTQHMKMEGGKCCYKGSYRGVS